MQTFGHSKRMWLSSKKLPPFVARVWCRPSSDWSSKNTRACTRKEASAVLLTKKIKLEVSEQDAATLEFMQGKCRGLYNWWVMRLRKGERWPGVYAARKTL